MSENSLHRIKIYLDSKGISVREFEQKAGMSNGSFASQVKNNKTIGVDKLENILRVFPELNPDWVLTGNGQMLKTKDNTIIIDPDNPVVNLLIDRIEKLAAENARLKEENNAFKEAKKYKESTHTELAAEP